MPKAPTPTVMPVEGSVILQWADGVQLQLSRLGGAVVAKRLVKTRRRRLRSSTQMLREAMQADAKAGDEKEREHYMGLLRRFGGPAKDEAARLVVYREFNRAFYSPSADTAVAPKREKNPMGRPPNPATRVVREAMQADAKAGKPRTRRYYISMLGRAGGPTRDSMAKRIVDREARRIFEKPLHRGALKPAPRGKRTNASPATLALRKKLAEDQAKMGLRDTAFYVRWMTEHPDFALREEVARPLVYRELRRTRQ